MWSNNRKTFLRATSLLLTTADAVLKMWAEGGLGHAMLKNTHETL
jgi:hypothetical protein